MRMNEQIVARVAEALGSAVCANTLRVGGGTHAPQHTYRLMAGRLHTVLPELYRRRPQPG